MKYLTKELYIICFHREIYNANQDKFLIGYLNKDNKKLKDVITGQIVENYHFVSIDTLKSFKKGGIQMSLGYMTGLMAATASIRQRILAKQIDAMLEKDVIDEKDILKIKIIINKEVVKTHNKTNKDISRIEKQKESIKKYSIDETERNF